MSYTSSSPSGDRYVHRHNLKAQIAYEYLLLIFFFTAAFTVWLVISSAAQTDLSWQLDEHDLEDFALGLQDECYTAAMQPIGYTQTITLPVTINGKEYNLTFHDQPTGPDYFTLTLEDHFIEKDLPDLALPTTPHYQPPTTTLTLQQGAQLRIT